MALDFDVETDAINSPILNGVNRIDFRNKAKLFAIAICFQNGLGHCPGNSRSPNSVRVDVPRTYLSEFQRLYPADYFFE